MNAFVYVRDRLGEIADSVEVRWAIVFLLVMLIADIRRKGWTVSWTRRAIKSATATIAIFHLNMLFAPFIYLVSEEVKTLYGMIGLPSVPTAFWDGVPLWLLVPFAVLAYDFADYWSHRLMHMRWLWPVHAIHHSDPDVSGLTAYRVHVLELLVMWVSYTLLLTWLGLPEDVLGVGAVLLTLHTMYVHIDRDWGHGPFALLLASPRFHRWHHADVKAAYGKNLANVFPIYDWLFGTYRVPGPCNAAMGAKGVPENDVLKLMAFPFAEWSRIVGRSLRQRAENAPPTAVAMTPETHS